MDEKQHKTAKTTENRIVDIKGNIIVSHVKKAKK